MFSYRHAFHAGNHADVLKHLVVLGALTYLVTSKDTPLLLADTHAGTGWYRLDGKQAHTSGEADAGVRKLWQLYAPTALQADKATPLLHAYLAMLQRFNHGDALDSYPGSPFILHEQMRPQDQLKLFELMPADARLLEKNLTQAGARGQIQVQHSDGFAGLKSLLPPPSRRALVLMDPSYELKTDYAQVQATVQDAVQRFATGCYLVWYPIIPRPESHALPKRLKALAKQAERPWLHATLSIGRGDADTQGRDGLRASGMFCINPPFVLKDQLQTTLPLVNQALQRGAGHGWLLEASA